MNLFIAELNEGEFWWPVYNEFDFIFQRTGVCMENSPTQLISVHIQRNSYSRGQGLKCLWRSTHF